jgi:hypothetical protein
LKVALNTLLDAKQQGKAVREWIGFVFSIDLRIFVFSFAFCPFFCYLLPVFASFSAKFKAAGGSFLPEDLKDASQAEIDAFWDKRRKEAKTLKAEEYKEHAELLYKQFERKRAEAKLKHQREQEAQQMMELYKKKLADHERREQRKLAKHKRGGGTSDDSSEEEESSNDEAVIERSLRLKKKMRKRRGI